MTGPEPSAGIPAPAASGAEPGGGGPTGGAGGGVSGAAASDAAAGDGGVNDAGATSRGTGDGGVSGAGVNGGGVNDAGARPGLKVAYVLGLATGGTAAHVVALARGCSEAGFAVSVLAPPPTLALFTAGAGPGYAADAGSGITMVPVAIGARPRPAADAAAVARLRSVLASWRPDVVHAHGIRAGAFSALALALLRRSARPALVVTVHNAPPDGQRARIVYGALERICARRADLVLCASPDLLARIRALGAASAELFDVPAARADRPAPSVVARAAADVHAGGRPVVLAVGRLAHQKGLDVLIAAAAHWRARDPQPRVVIAGDGPLAAALRDQARAAGTDVLFLGSRQDVPALLEVADVVAVPSRWEARALIVQEAMGAGRPVVATRVGGTPDLTGTDAAVLIPPDDPAALAAAIAAVLDDPHLAARLGETARVRSASFPSQDDAVRSLAARYARLARPS